MRLFALISATLLPTATGAGIPMTIRIGVSMYPPLTPENPAISPIAVPSPPSR